MSRSINSIYLNIFTLIIYLHFFLNASHAYMLFHTVPDTPPAYYTTKFTPNGKNIFYAFINNIFSEYRCFI